MDNDQEVKDVLKEILKWTKFEGMRKVKQVLESTLDTDTKKLIYELSNGKSSPEIAEMVGVDPMTVRNYWKDWVILGITEICQGYRRRYCRVFSLKEVGIEVPAMKGATTEEGKGSEEET